MTKKPNSLQAVLERKSTEAAADPVPPKPVANDAKARERPAKTGRGPTTLIGGHFAPEVARQLGIIAAEEGTTKQALLTEALDMLFVKKGKARISQL